MGSMIVHLELVRLSKVISRIPSSQSSNLFNILFFNSISVKLVAISHSCTFCLVLIIDLACQQIKLKWQA